MHITVNTDSTIEGSEAFRARIRSLVEKAWGHLTSHVTRVEVHVADENGAKTIGDDKRCLMEARFKGRPLVAVSYRAATVHAVVNGTAETLANLFDHTLGKLRHERRNRTDPAH